MTYGPYQLTSTFKVPRALGIRNETGALDIEQITYNTFVWNATGRKICILGHLYLRS